MTARSKHAITILLSGRVAVDTKLLKALKGSVSSRCDPGYPGRVAKMENDLEMHKEALAEIQEIPIT